MDRRPFLPGKPVEGRFVDTRQLAGMEEGKREVDECLDGIDVAEND